MEHKSKIRDAKLNSTWKNRPKPFGDATKVENEYVAIETYLGRLEKWFEGFTPTLKQFCKDVLSILPIVTKTEQLEARERIYKFIEANFDEKEMKEEATT